MGEDGGNGREKELGVKMEGRMRRRKGIRYREGCVGGRRKDNKEVWGGRGRGDDG